MRSSATTLDKQTCLLPSRDKAMNHRHHPFIQEISHHLFTFLQKLLYKKTSSIASLVFTYKQPTPFWNPLFTHAWQIGMLGCYSRLIYYFHTTILSPFFEQKVYKKYIYFLISNSPCLYASANSSKAIERNFFIAISLYFMYKAISRVVAFS